MTPTTTKARPNPRQATKRATNSRGATSQSILVATRKGLFTVTRAGRSWRFGNPEFRGVPVSMMLDDPRDGALYAALDHGHFGVKLHRKRGRRWQEVAVPVYPQLPKGKVEREGGGRPWPRTLQLIWSLEIDPRTPGGLWCGTIPGGLFHSADGGDSWQLVTGLWHQKKRRKWFGGGYDTPGIHSILVDPRDPERVTVGVSCGGAWRTENGGRTWRNVAHGMRADYAPKGKAYVVDSQDPHRLAMCAAAPDRIWCQHHNGIFRTGRGGRFQESKAKAVSRFGFACAAHPTDPDTAWFVPAQKDECRVPVGGKMVVLKTTDGGRTLRALRKGLPQQHCYDLVYRHGLDVSMDGETLVMGSTTGGLWLGESGGRSWRALSSSLPPVFAVRFHRA